MLSSTYFIFYRRRSKPKRWQCSKFTYRSRKVGGSGLGLAICKHIIEAHEETIHIRSKIDVGSTFGFTLQSKKD